MPIILSITLLILFLPFTTSQPILQFLDDNTATTNLTISQNSSETRRLNLPSVNATLRLEWTSLNQTAFPSTIFYLSNSSNSPIRLFGNSLHHNPNAANHTCNVTQPCATISTIDFQSFYTRSPRSFLRFPFSETTQSLFVTVLNHQTIPAAPFIPSSPDTLRGVLSVRIVTESDDCPGGVFPNDPVCSGRGKCVKSQCQCDNDYADRACHTNVIPLPSVNEPPDETFLVKPPPNSYTARVDLFESVIFSSPQRTLGTVPRFEVLLLRGKIPGNNDTESREAPVLWMFIAPPPFGPPLLKQNLTLPSFGNTAVKNIQATEDLFCVRTREDNETVYLRFYALPTEDAVDRGYAIVNVNQTEISRSLCNTRASSLPLGLALVPAFLVTTAVAATGVLVMVWLDCRHSFTNRVDRLSSEEIERMYPSTPYNAQTVECPICLSEIEPPQQVRNLKCNHVYHTECLDPWLTENRASCPTCRTDVRVEQLSDKRHMRRIVQFFLAPLVHIRRLRERRRGPALADQDSQDLETGDAGETLNPESNHQLENSNGDETQHETTATQPTEVSPQSPVADNSR